MKRERDRGLLVVFEGIDGAGKSSLAKAVASELRTRGHKVVTSREPTDGVHGRRLRESAIHGRLPASEELDLFLKDRMEHVDQVILPALRSGAVVILDRYYFSTAAYQGARGLDWRDVLEKNEAFAPEPDRLILLDLSIREALHRIGNRGLGADEFERAESLEKVREIFLSADRPYRVVLDALKTPETLCIESLAWVFP